MKKNDSIYLSHILDSIERIEEYTKGMEKKDFSSSNLVQDGTIRQIEIIGEATKSLSKDLREEYSQISWRDIAGMRDRLIHHYFGINVDIVWQIIRIDLPKLKEDLSSLLNK